MGRTRRLRRAARHQAQAAPGARGAPRRRAQLAERSHALPPEVEDTIARVRAEHLTYLKPDGLRELAAGVREVGDRGSCPAS